jgi:KaiC/GvpD/RAD55 family RecA-like ATPase
VVDMSGYTTGIKELDDEIEGIKKGSNIMLIGPPMSGKKAILNYMAYYSIAKNDNAVIKVATSESGTQFLELFKENKLNLPKERFGIVDCFTKSFSSNAIENENIKIVNSPADLTGINVKIRQFFEEFFIKKNVHNVQVHIDSLSTILMYSNIQVVFRFLHVLTGRIKASGTLGIYVVDSGVHNETEITTLKQLCDGVIEIKSENDANLIRIVGLSSKPTPWFDYEIDGLNVRIQRKKKNQLNVENVGHHNNRALCMT